MAFKYNPITGRLDRVRSRESRVLKVNDALGNIQVDMSRYDTVLITASGEFYLTLVNLRNKFLSVFATGGSMAENPVRNNISVDVFGDVISGDLSTYTANGKNEICVWMRDKTIPEYSINFLAKE